MIIWVDDYDSIEICAMAPYAETPKLTIREKLRLARDRADEIPHRARPVWTRPFKSA